MVMVQFCPFTTKLDVIWPLFIVNVEPHLPSGVPSTVQVLLVAEALAPTADSAITVAAVMLKNNLEIFIVLPFPQFTCLYYHIHLNLSIRLCLLAYVH